MRENGCGPVEMQFVGTKAQGGLVLALNAMERVGELARRMGQGRVLLVADQAVAKAYPLSGIVSLLAAQNLEVFVYDGVAGEPTYDSVRQTLAAAGKAAFSMVIGVGGGSAMDTAKAAALCGAAHTTDPALLFEDPKTIREALPVMLCPTTAGTGSEVSPYAVLSSGSEKRFVTASCLYPTFALIDPMLAVTLPPEPTAFTALDALTHGIEGACGKTNPFTLAYAAQCARLIFCYLPRAVKDGGDLEARYSLACAAVLGMMAYTQGGGLYAHSMSYLLSGAHRMPHGKGCALALPCTLELNQSASAEVLRVLEEATGVRERFPDALRTFIRSFRLPTTLKEAGVCREELPALAEGLLARYPRKANPVALEKESAIALVERMYG